MRRYPWMALALFALLLVPAATFADTLSPNLGYISFVTLTDADGNSTGFVGFDIINVTGGFLPPSDDFPVTDAVTLLDSSLTLNDTDGTSTTYLLGDLVPGAYTLGDTSNPGGSLPLVQFADTDSFSSGTFTAVLSETNINLLDGTFSADLNLSVDLGPSPGATNLQQDTDSWVITASSPVAAPEPSSVVLLFTGLFLLVRFRPITRNQRLK